MQYLVIEPWCCTKMHNVCTAFTDLGPDLLGTGVCLL